MIGIVLCGGQSLRMGADKGMLLSDENNWASIAAEKLNYLNIPVKFSVNTAQEKVYGTLFSSNRLVPDHVSLAIGGPLLGVLSAHLLTPNEDLFILACDLLLMDKELMANLIEAQNKNDDFEAYVFTINNKYEPLCGIYTAKGLKKIASLLAEGNLIKHSMMFALDQLHTCTIALRVDDQRYFKNFNSPDELNSL